MIPNNHLMPLIPRPDVIMSHGKGSWLFDTEGKRYLDFIQGWAVNALGHAPHELQLALQRQSEQLLSASPAYYNAPQLELCRRLCDAAGLDLAFLCSSGAEAVETAIKLARKWGRHQRSGAFEVLSTQGGFHGRTLAAMAASGKPGFDEMFPPNPPGFRKLPYADVGALEAAISERTAAVLLEPIQGEAGVIVPPAGYLNAVRQLCTQHGLLLILDEIQTGIGRTGTLFRFEAEDVRPDVLLLGKQLGGGVPLAATLCSQRAYGLEPGEHGGTYAGNPLMAACGLAVLDAVDQELLSGVRAAGEKLQAGLTELGMRHGFTQVRGAGLLCAVELDRPRAAAVTQACFERGLLLNAPRPRTLRFMPQLRVSPSEISTMLETLDLALATTT